jgi:beta-galactosidase
MLMDDFIGDEIHKNEQFTKKQADIVKEALNYVALHGYHFPPHIVASALRCILVYHMTPGQAVSLYNKYVGDWGGTSTVYRFEAVRDGAVVKTIVKEPMHRLHIHAAASAAVLVEEETYDVAEVRITMRDEHDNQLYFYNDPVCVSAEGPIEVIGPDVVSCQGGMTGVYVRTTGRSGSARLHLASGGAEPVIVEFEVKTI